MSNDSISPWWVEVSTRVTLPRPAVDAVIDKLEGYTGRTVADRDAFHRGLQEAVTCHREEKEDHDQRPTPAKVQKEYQKLLESIENVCRRLNRIASSVLLSRPLCQTASYSNFSVAEAKEKLGYGPGGFYDEGEVAAGLACKQVADLHGLFQAALAAASFDADQHPSRGALSKRAHRNLAGDIAELYEAAVGLRAGGSGTETSVASPFVRHFNDVRAIAEPDKPPVTARTVLRYLKTCRQHQARISYPDDVRG